MITTAQELLESAAHVALIARTRRAFARAESGNSVNTFEKAACKWCAAGLLEAAAELVPLDRRYVLLGEARNLVVETLHATGRRSIESWNDSDSTTSTDVYNLFMRAAHDYHS